MLFQPSWPGTPGCLFAAVIPVGGIALVVIETFWFGFERALSVWESAYHTRYTRSSKLGWSPGSEDRVDVVREVMGGSGGASRTLEAVLKPLAFLQRVGERHWRDLSTEMT